MPSIDGTPSDDILYGTQDPDVITALAGNDRLFGFGGDDTLDGGDNDDTLDGGTGADTMTGGAGNDFYVVDDAGDVVTELAGGGSDLVFTYITYTLPAEVERLAVYSRSSTYALNLTGNALDNELIGNDGANFLDGGAGADIMQGAGGDDQFLVSLQGTVTLSASPSDSSLGGLGYLYLNSTAPDLVYEAAGGGIDTVWVPFTGSVAAHDYFDYTLIRGSDLYQVAHIENLAVYDPGSTYAVNLQGDMSDNEVRGNDGRNLLDGWTGADTLIGYGGDDIYLVQDKKDQVIEAAGQGYDTVYVSGPLNGYGGYTLPANVERVVGMEGEGFSYYLTGNALDNELVGSSLDDTLNGGGGGDLMMGGNGNDTYIIDLADRIVDTGGFDTVVVTFDYTLGDYVEGLTGLGTVGLRLTGNAADNGILGADSTTAADIIDGGLGADQMAGRRGNDIYFVDNVSDRVIEYDHEGYDTVYIAQVNFTLGAEVERGGALDRASTVAFNLTGNILDNELWGDDGANIIDGKLGSDILQGLGGADRFVFSTSLAPGLYGTVDQLVDFEAGVDTIGLDDAIFAALTPGVLAAGAFHIGTTAQDADDFILYNPATGQVSYDGDGNGATLYPVLFAVVHEATPLTAADFVVV